MKRLLFLVFILLLTFFSACKRRHEISFEFPDGNPLAYLPGSQWAVIKEPLVGLRESDSYESKVTEHVRRGDVFEVTGKRISNVKDADGKNVVVTWYGFDIGWAESSVVLVYDNKMRAENASEKMNRQQ